MKTFFKYFSIPACTTAIFISFLPVWSLANTTKTYRPPRGEKREQARKAGGSRGCRIPLRDTVTLLIPQDHTATTVSSHPTFFWHLSQKLSLPLRFTLLEPGKKPILTKELKPEPGIVALKLPQSSKPLEVGKTYRWTVTVICNDDKPSRNLFAQAWIERVSLATSNSNSENASNKSSCSDEYAQVGIWYDALNCAYTAQLLQFQDINNDEMKKFWSLLKDIDLDFIARQ
ncbi:DUF928 domain-containing protein [Pleurocapsa sp. PCC 7319]|uniref:DUF928 domain-containing protein n=1 Tax=Pleurocapsa sp. PCC 7319 TaxID=118161 RepID=UPI000348D19A|nr:DUF928 domain-containing protein [Pleurocapsa sp. PCC 7319]